MPHALKLLVLHHFLKQHLHISIVNAMNCEKVSKHGEVDLVISLPYYKLHLDVDSGRSTVHILQCET